MPKPLRALLIGCTVIAIVSVGTVGPAFAKKPQPKVVVTPHKNLTNGGTVMVSVSNFLPNSQVFIVECVKQVRGKTGIGEGEPYCDVTHTTPVQTNGSGSFAPTAFTVLTGAIAQNGDACGISKATKKCYVGVGDDDGDSDDDGLGAITFVVPK
jgi:hypothetical protein